MEDKTEQELKRLEERVEELIRICERLKEENRQLRAQQNAYAAERTMLIEKNEAARVKVESMINRLKSMEQP